MMSKRDFKRLHRDIDRLIMQAEKGIFSNYEAALKELKGEISKLYEKYSIGGKLTEREMLKYNRIKALEKDIVLTVNMTYERNHEEIANTLKRAFRDTSKSLMTIVSEETGKQLKAITKARDVNKTINDNMAGLNWAERQGKHRADLIYDIQKTVKEGIAQGDTYRTMAKRLNKEVDVSMNKATTIVRTEAARVNAAAQKETLDKVEAAGVKMTKTWNNVMDERSRGYEETDETDHMAMNDVTVPYGDNFTLPDGVETFAPKMTGEAKHDINCRCFIAVEFE